MADTVPIAFYAPLKAPDHPTPSGDRRMARLFLKALSTAGFTPEIASRFRAFVADPSEAAFAARAEAALAESHRLVERYRALPASARPRLWFTYHLYYKAPDFLGPRIAAELEIPYVVAEASRSKKRFSGPWAESAMDAEAGIDLADVIFCLTSRDRPALDAALDSTQTLVDLPPFLELPAAPREREASKGPLRLLTVAMMRPGDKLASYRTLADALGRARADWRLEVVGDGPAAEEVRELFGRFGDRVQLRGQLAEDAVARAYGDADLLVWPGVGEAFGMAYLEARAHGLPVLAEDRPGVRDVIGEDGLRAPPDDPAALAAALDEASSDRAGLAARGRAARSAVERAHSIATAAGRLRSTLRPIIAEDAPRRPCLRDRAS
ncbi:MAG: glycosyltransferase family 4 protein [Pseudomonadota bacterium]